MENNHKYIDLLAKLMKNLCVKVSLCLSIFILDI